MDNCNRGDLLLNKQNVKDNEILDIVTVVSVDETEVNIEELKICQKEFNMNEIEDKLLGDNTELQNAINPDSNNPVNNNKEIAILT